MANLSPDNITTKPNNGVQSSSAFNKRVIICCDGTWEDGIVDKQRWQYTNIMRLARALNHMDNRHQPPKPQVVYYQTGIGTSNIAIEQYYDGATGASLNYKVEEAYTFISQNYHIGDEIFIFGFSRGAYTARMIADFIGAIGVLDRTDMDQFATICSLFMQRGATQNKDDMAKIDEKLSRWTSPDSTGKKRASWGPDTYCIKCVAVFDTVGAIGLPKEIPVIPEQVKNIFGFVDTRLGEHIERAYHALAINETRKDFNCTKFEQTPEGKAKGQVLKQCWFAGSHADIGGGYEQHDLSDISLSWMVSNVEDILSFNVDYLAGVPDPVAPWGQLSPHNPITGVYDFAFQIHRTLPTSTNDVTHETVHSSVLQQKKLPGYVEDDLKKHTNLVCSLTPLEEHVRAQWAFPQNAQPVTSVETTVVKKMKVSENDHDGTHTRDVIYTETHTTHTTKGGKV